MPRENDSSREPNAAAPGIFGTTAPDATIRLLPVPFDATCSYGRGTARGPAAILRASTQVDLYDPWFGHVAAAGIRMDGPDPRLVELGTTAAVVARPVLDAGAATGPELGERARRVDELSARRSEIVESWTRDRLASRRVPGIVGGDHSCALGAIRAAADGRPVSVLQVDAHLDLRRAYQGFRESHASIMRNVVETCPGVERLVQVGIRDFCEAERDFAAAAGNRVRTHYWTDWCRELFGGTAYAALAGAAIADLGPRVWISFDADGLDPALCPGTGTPVPGGLGFDQAAYLLFVLARSGREIAGFDLCEVGAAEWDGNVGARLLYKLCGLARVGSRVG